MIKLHFMLLVEPIVVNHIIVSISLCIVLSYSKVYDTKKSLYVAAVCSSGERLWEVSLLGDGQCRGSEERAVWDRDVEDLGPFADAVPADAP